MKKFLLFILLLSFSAKAEIDNVRALNMALDDEYKAKTTYEKVIDDFGNVKPFISIVKAEQRHISALLPFYAKYGVAIPDNPYEGKISSFESVEQACLVGVQAEIQNVALYDDLFSMTNDPSLIKVFEQLRWVSQTKHLPAFERCVNFDY